MGTRCVVAWNRLHLQVGNEARRVYCKPGVLCRLRYCRGTAHKQPPFVVRLIRLPICHQANPPWTRTTTISLCVWYVGRVCSPRGSWSVGTHMGLWPTTMGNRHKSKSSRTPPTRASALALTGANHTAPPNLSQWQCHVLRRKTRRSTPLLPASSTAKSTAGSYEACLADDPDLDPKNSSVRPARPPQPAVVS